MRPKPSVATRKMWPSGTSRYACRDGGLRSDMLSATWLSPSPRTPWHTAQWISKRARPLARSAAVTGSGPSASGFPSGPSPVATAGATSDRYGTVPAGGARMAIPSAW